MAAGICFIAVFAVFSTVFLRPPRIRTGHAERYVQAAADLLAHAADSDRSDFAEDLLVNIPSIVQMAQFRESHGPTSAFLFRYSKQMRDAAYARSFLSLLSEPAFCAVMVSRAPWITAEIFDRIADKELVARSANQFIQEICRQAIVCPESMMGREIGYKGFRAAPVLSNALFENNFIRRFYEPINWISFGDFRTGEAYRIERLNHAVIGLLQLALDERDFWGDNSFHSTADFYRDAVWTARETFSEHDRRYELVSAIGPGLKKIIEITKKSLSELPDRTYVQLFLKSEERDFILLDYISEIIVETIFSFSNDFNSDDDPFWHIMVDIDHNLFSRFGDNPDGFDPLQQRVAVKLLSKVQQNMDGWYPSVTRPLLAIMAPFEDKTEKNPNSARSIFKRAVFKELKRFPELYQRDAEKAVNKLPDNVRYEAESQNLIRRYSGGEEYATNLDELEIEEISFFDENLWQRRQSGEEAGQDAAQIAAHTPSKAASP